VTAVKSGADIVLYTAPGDGTLASRALLAATRDGSLPEGRVREAYDHVVALKSRVLR
jgi:hypothetical protein